MSEHDALRTACAGLALGILDPEERGALEAHLAAGCPECETELRALGVSLAMLGLSVTPHAPERRLRRRVLSRIGDETFYWARASEPDWEPTGVAGVDLRRLFIARSGAETLVVRMAPGARHTGLPRLAESMAFVLDGDFQAGGTSIAAGEACALEGLAAGVERSTQGGCTLFTVATPPPTAVRAAAAPVAIRPDDLAWMDYAPGAFIRPLHADSRGTQMVLARMEAGYSYHEHRHEGDEELFMLSGDCRIMDIDFWLGDYHRAPQDSDHGLTTTRGGCTLLLVLNAPH